MELFIIRHGVAEDASKSGRDFDRALTSEGKERIEATARALEKLELEFDIALTSPLVRARETAQIIADRCEPKLRVLECAPLTSGLDSKGLFDELKNHGANSKLLLAGHEPDLSRLISTLLSGSASLAIAMKKGSLARLVCAGHPEPGNCRLEWLLTPRQLCKIAGKQKE